MLLNGIKSLYLSMKKQHIDRYRFDYKNGKGDFDIFFFIDENPFVLLFGAKNANFYFEIEVKKGFNIDINLENEIYKKLIEFLGMGVSYEDPFSTFKFFEDFGLNIPTSATQSNIAKPELIIKYRQNVEEVDKVFFWKWLDNTKQGNRVSHSNLDKTKKLLGIQAYKRCKFKNISSCWTDDKNKNKIPILP